MRLGEWDLTEDPDCFENSIVCAPKVKDIEVAKNIVHSKYSKRASDTKNDIALLRLKVKVKFHKFLHPICLPLDASLKDFDYTSRIFEVSGWGEQACNGIPFWFLIFCVAGKTETLQKSSVKLKVDLRFFPLDRCNEKYLNKVIDKSQVHKTKIIRLIFFMQLFLRSVLVVVPTERILVTATLVKH